MGTVEINDKTRFPLGIVVSLVIATSTGAAMFTKLSVASDANAQGLREHEQRFEQFMKIQLDFNARMVRVEERQQRNERR